MSDREYMLNEHAERIRDLEDRVAELQQAHLSLLELLVKKEEAERDQLLRDVQEKWQSLGI